MRIRLSRPAGAAAAAALLASVLAVAAPAPPAEASHPTTPVVRDVSMGNLASNDRELSIAVDPNNPNRLMAGANQRGAGTGQVWYQSVDGGRTWTSGSLPLGTLTAPPGTTAGSVTMSDPSLAYGNDGRLYYSALIHAASGEPGTLFVGATSDQGATWTDLNNGIVAAGTQSPNVLQDKEHIFVDQANNNVYVAWTPIGGANNQEVVFSRDLAGAADGFAFSAPVVITDETAFDGCLNQGTDMAMVGTRIYLSWTSFCSGFSHGDTGTVNVTWSDDLGVTWPNAPVVAMTIDNVDFTSQGFRARSHTSIDANPAAGGRIYVVAASNTDTAGNDDSDVLMTTSTDGTTWTAPAAVNAEPGGSDQDEQWMPWVAVGQGRVHVMYFCWDDEGTAINACFAYANEAAAPTFTELTISSAVTPTSTGFLGDYNGNFVGSDNVVHPAWGDGRAGNGGATDGYSARVDFSPPHDISLSGPATKPWGQNATFDAHVSGASGENEQFIPVTFTVTGGGSPTPASSAAGLVTDASGNASFSFTNAAAGTNTVQVWADLNENGATDPGETRSVSIEWTAHPTTTTYTGPASGTYSDSAHLSGTLSDALLGTPIAGETLTLSVGTDSCSDTTDAAGVAECDATLTQVPGPYTAKAEYAGSTLYGPSSGTAPFTINKETTVSSYTGPTLIANNLPVTLSATLAEDDGPAVAGRTVSFSLGTAPTAQSCSGVTDVSGSASCTISSVSQPLGAGVVTATFTGDAYYLGSSANAATIVFQWTTGGNFVIGDGNAAVGSTPTFWSNEWYLANSVSGGTAPTSFKGFANLPSGPTSCGGANWSTGGGNSPPPAGMVPSYTAMLVTSSVTKTNKTVSGTKPKIVIVRVNPGYAPSPGHPGTGTVVAVLCQ